MSQFEWKLWVSTNRQNVYFSHYMPSIFSHYMLSILFPLGLRLTQQREQCRWMVWVAVEPRPVNTAPLCSNNIPTAIIQSFFVCHSQSRSETRRHRTRRVFGYPFALRSSAPFGRVEHCFRIMFAWVWQSSRVRTFVCVFLFLCRVCAKVCPCYPTVYCRFLRSGNGLELWSPSYSNNNSNSNDCAT